MKVLLLVLAIFLGVYVVFVVGLFIAGKRTHARAIGGFIPDCIILFKRLLQDSRTPKRYRFELILLIGYLALPIDLIPDFIPVAGQLDDAIIVTLVLRRIVKSVGVEVVKELWTGPTSSLNVILKLTGR